MNEITRAIFEQIGNDAVTRAEGAALPHDQFIDGLEVVIRTLQRRLIRAQDEYARPAFLHYNPDRGYSVAGTIR